MKKSKIILKIVLALYLIGGLAAVGVYAKNNDTTENQAQEETTDDDAASTEVIDRTDDISAELEEVQYKLDEVTADEQTDTSDIDTSDTSLDEDGVGYAEVEEVTDETADEQTDTDDASNGDYVGEAVVNVEGGNGLNMRTGPGKEYGVITDYKNGTTLYIVDGDGTENWVHVSDGENEGYMSGKHLDITMY